MFVLKVPENFLKNSSVLYTQSIHGGGYYTIHSREFRTHLQEAFKSADDTKKHFTVNRDNSVHHSSALWAVSEIQIR